MRPAGIGGRPLKPIRRYSTFSPTIWSTACSWPMLKLPAGRGKDALKTLTALDALGDAEQRTTRRITLARSDAAASLGDSKLRRDMADLAAQEAGEAGSQAPGGSRTRFRVPGFGGSGRKRKGEKCLRRSQTDLRSRRRPQRLSADPARYGGSSHQSRGFPAAEKLYSQALTNRARCRQSKRSSKRTA